MRIDVLTLFPEVCEPFFSGSILGRAQAGGLATIKCHNIRDYTADSHKKVDDRPFGGGPGMVMMCQPVFDAVEAVEREDVRPATRILLTPQGERFDQRMAEQLSKLSRLLLVAGHYEGFDERIRQGLSPRQISIGDYVLSGGEVAAMAVVDAVVRLLPGVLGDTESIKEESFSRFEEAVEAVEDEIEQPVMSGRYLEYPQYTRPREFRGMSVPPVLFSGDHAKVKAWRREQSILRTVAQRPDLMSAAPMDEKKQVRREE